MNLCKQKVSYNTTWVNLYT